MARTKKETTPQLIDESSEEEAPPAAEAKPTRRRRTAKATETDEPAQEKKTTRRRRKTAETEDGEEAPTKPKRAPTKYNLFVKRQMEEMKDMEGVTHKEKFKLAAERWKTSPENPKNQTSEASA